MITSQALHICIKQLQENIDAIDPLICRQFPIAAYIDEVKTKKSIRTHSYYRPRRKKSFSTIKKQYGSSGMALYHKLALGLLIQDTLECLDSKPFPDGIIKYIYSWCKRVIRDFDRLPDSYYDVSETNFNIDLGVCCLKNLPIGGAWFVQIHMMSPRIFLTLDMRRVVRILKCIFFNVRGVSPYCIIHTVPRYMMRFNCQQMNNAYQQIGDLLKYRPEIKGIFRKSWFLDPELININPEMGYLRKIPLDNGAVFFKAGTTRYDIRDALAFSHHRRKLFNEGKYLPTVYGYIWPRKAFLRWLSQRQND